MTVYDRLEHDLKLSDLINEESLQNLVREFSEAHELTALVMEVDGTLLQGEPLTARDCPDSKADCPGCRATLPLAKDTTDKYLPLRCPDGTTFVQARIENQFDTIGYLLVGPFESEEGGDEPVGVAKVGHRLAHLLCVVLQEVAFANYQSYLVSKMQLQASSENLGELVSKDGELIDGTDEMKRYEDTLLDSQDLRGLF
ncbi:MAG: PocR ligand-binding domain-containing protein [Acidobacteriota bacterium]